MKINLISDIHLETYKLNFPTGVISIKKIETFFPGLFSCDILILAGDILTSPRVLGDLVRQSPIPVIYVLGNHEYYGRDWDNTAEQYKDALAKTSQGVLLDRDTIVLGDVKFIGATLWTDFHKEDPLVIYDAANGINDFRQIAGCTPERMLAQFKGDRLFLRNALKDSANTYDKEKTVVITHFGPSYQSQHSSYPAGGLGYYFVSDLEDLIYEFQPKIWAHGHTHDSCDYMIGQTRVVSCQPGYEWEARGEKHPPISFEI